MFNDTDDGQTQYCPMCLEWAEKYEKLEAENERLKAENEELKEKVNSYNCSSNCYKYRKSEKYKQALEEIREIINFRFKTPYMKLGLKETDKIIEDIEKIINEVLK